MDKFNPETRSKIMSSIRARSNLEAAVCKALWKKGARFRTNVKDLFGKPDISIKKYKLVIFIDSCFWHCCPLHETLPKSNIDYWANKLQKNKERDIIVNSYYENKGWRLLRVWEHQIRKDFNGTVDLIFHFIEKAKGNPEDNNIFAICSLICRLITDIAFSWHLFTPVYFSSQLYLRQRH